MGLHTGEPLVEDEGYVGIDVHRAARVAHAGHGGQVLLSQTTTPLVQDQLPPDVTLIDLGRHRLKDMRRPERVSQLAIKGLDSEFPPLASLEALPPQFPEELGPAEPPRFLANREAELDLRPVFVGRERELERLGASFRRTLDGQGEVAFVIGGPGRGKTALMREFGRRAMDMDPDVLVTYGNCSAFTGAGEPYSPFRQSMSMLAGDVEERWRARAIGRQHAIRLWEAMPQVVQSIVEYGRDLVDVFVPGRPLLDRLLAASQGGGALGERLASLIDGRAESPSKLEQRYLFDQYDYVLAKLAGDHPLILILDDLQWADNASINLLFHIGRRLDGTRILLLGGFRPEEVALGRGPEPHPLAPLISEFKRSHGDMIVDISQTTEEEDRHFVASYIDQEPNALDTTFRQAIYRHTRGHPLFTVEMLRDLRERGDLLLDEDVGWVESPHLDWDVLPARVEGVMEERVARLGGELQETLRIACVEGTQFTAQVLAGVKGMEARTLVQQLTHELGRRHRLVEESGVREIDGRRLYRYHFYHDLLQQHLYSTLGEFERAELHREIGEQLEHLYSDQTETIAPQLARHFVEAGATEKAIQYLIVSGDQARLVYATREAIEYYTQALDHMQSRADQTGIAQTLLKLALVHTANFDTEAAEAVYSRAFALLDEMPQEERASRVGLPGAHLRMAIEAPNEWDPGLIGDDVSSFIAAQLFQGLTEVTSDYNVIPAAAQRWDIAEGGRRYTFHLRPDQKWSDGTPLTAHDFKYAWRRNLRRGGDSPLSSLLMVIRGAQSARTAGDEAADEPDVRCLDDHTLRVQLIRPSAYFPQLMAHQVAFPAPRWNVEKHGPGWPDRYDLVCNGPYMIESWSPGEHLTLVRNPHFLGHISGNVARVDCTLIGEFDQVLEAYANGDLDAVSMINTGAREVARARARFPDELKFAPSRSTFYLTFLVSQPPFDDVRVRKAFIQAVDREKLIQEASRGQYQPASGGFVPPGMPGYSPGIGMRFDPDQARQVMRAAGYASGDQFPAITLLSAGGGKDDPNVRFLCRAWREQLGVEVVYESVEWGEFLYRRDHDPAPLSLSGWSADYTDPDSMLRVLFHSTEGLNPPRWKDKHFDTLVEKAASTMDQGERIELYQRADRILVAEEAVVMPLGYSQGRDLMKPWVRMPNVAPNLLRIKDVILIRPD